MNVVEASGLGKRYGGTWALRECTLEIPAGRVAALVGPNGAGKTTLLNLAVGLTAPSAGEVTVLGGRPAGSPAALDGIAFVAQDTPLYKNLSVADMIYVTRSLNRRFDQPYARARLDELGIPLKRKAGKLSGGQQAQLALTLALARRPRLLVLDEPVAMLDPVARHDFMATVLAAAAADGVSVLLSSHVLTELERVAELPHPAVPGPGAAGRGSRDLLAAHGQASLEELAMAYLRETHAGGDAMTALTMPARPDAGRRRLRPVPWRRMAGVTWRQHRIALAGVAVLLGALAVWLWIIGISLHHAYAAAVACHPASSPACQNLIGTSTPAPRATFMGDKGPGGVLLQLVPALIGAFAGAPVLARELETGTFRYAWTQGFGRWRWALAKLVLLAVVLAAAASAFGVLVSWYYQPLFAAGQPGPRPFPRPPRSVPLFSLREVTFPAWTLAAFSIGALAGMLIRRVVPAIVATLAVYAGLAFATAGFLREHYLTPLVTTSNFEPARHRVDHRPVVDQGRQVRLRRQSPGQPPQPVLLFRSSRGRAGRLRSGSRSAWLRTATRSGPATSRPAGSGPSSGSRAAGCSRCQRCSSP